MKANKKKKKKFEGFTSKWLNKKSKQDTGSIIPDNENERRLLKEHALKQALSQAKIDKEHRYFLDKLDYLIKKLRIDEKRAVLLLHNPRFLNIWKRHIQHLGIVGEDQNIITLLIVLGGFRLVPDAKAESGNLVVDGKSSGGKSMLALLVLRSFVATMVEAFSRTSPKVLTYYERVDWTNKILSLIDAEIAVLNDPVMKIFLSGELKDSLIADHGKARHYRIKGKPAVVVTAVNPELAPQLIRRLPTIKIDESTEQTARILKKQAHNKKHNIRPKADVPRRLKMAYARLKPVHVMIPFADIIEKTFPKDDIISRTTFNWVIDYISFSAAMGQYLRKTIEPTSDKTIRIIKAKKADYNAARRIINSMKLTLQTVPLTQGHRDLLEILRKEKPDINKQKAIDGQIITGFTIKELETLTGNTKQTIHPLLTMLRKGGLVNRASIKGITKNPDVWWAAEKQKSFRLPKWKDLTH